METVLGLIGMAIYMVVVVSLAAGITWLVVKLFPSNEKKKKKPEPQAS